MKKSLLLASLLNVLIISSALSQKINLGSESTVLDYVERMVSYQNKVAVIGYYSTRIYLGLISLDYFDGEKWKNLPLIYKDTNNHYDTIKFKSSYHDIEFDKFGNLWVCGIGGYYKLDGNSFQKFTLDDSLVSKREFTRIRFDSSGNIWLAATFKHYDAITAPPITQFIKYDGLTYKIIDETDWTGFGTDYGLITAKDGRVLAHKYFLQDVEREDLFVFNNNASKACLMPSPHHLVSSLYKQTLKWIRTVIEDKDGNIWFGLDSYADDTGLLKWKQDGTWNTFTGTNGYLTRYNEFSELDTVYLPCKGIAQDNVGRIWIGGSGFLNIVDGKDQVSIPDSIDFFSKLVLYPKKYPDSSIYDNKRNYLKDSSFIHIYRLLKHSAGYTAVGPSEVTGITTTEDGSVWFAISGIGILRYNPKFNSVSPGEQSQAGVLIYPQPVSIAEGWITLAFGQQQAAKPPVFKLFSATGSLVLEKQIDAPGRTAQIQLPRSLSPGCYFAVIYHNNDIFRKILIVTN